MHARALQRRTRLPHVERASARHIAAR